MSRSVMIALLLDAATGGFYVAVTRGFLIPMYIAFRYDTTLISRVVGLQAVITLLVLVFLYRLGEKVCKRLRVKLLLAHVLERLFWALLPLVAPFPLLEIFFLTLANVIAGLVGLYITYLAYTHFERDELVKLFSRRFALGAVTSLIACIVTPVIVYALPPRVAYVIAYFLAAGVGWIGSITLFLTPFRETKITSASLATALPEHVEIRKVNVFLFYLLFNTYVNIVFITWIPLSKHILGLSDREITIFPLLSSIGTIVGSIFIRGVRACRIAAGAAVITYPLLPLLKLASLNYLDYTVLGITSVSGFIVTSIVYSGYVREIGHVRVSLLTQIGYAAGVALASILVYMLPQTILYYTSLIIGVLMLFVLYTAIPEVSIVPETLTLSFARTVYTVSIISGTYLMLLTREAISLFIKALALTLLIMLMYALYMILLALIS